MTKKLYLPLLMAMVVALFSSCSKKMGELSADYFTVTSTTAFLLKYFSGNLPLMVAGTLPPTASNTREISSTGKKKRSYFIKL